MARAGSDTSHDCASDAQSEHGRSSDKTGANRHHLFNSPTPSDAVEGLGLHEASLLPHGNAPDQLPVFEETMQQLSDTAMASYRALVYETPAFKEYFFESTPISEIAELNHDAVVDGWRGVHAVILALPNQGLPIFKNNLFLASALIRRACLPRV
jgi:hypothetical protein